MKVMPQQDFYWKSLFLHWFFADLHQTHDTLSEQQHTAMGSGFKSEVLSAKCTWIWHSRVSKNRDCSYFQLGRPKLVALGIGSHGPAQPDLACVECCCRRGMGADGNIYALCMICVVCRHVVSSLVLTAFCEMHVSFTTSFSLISVRCLEQILNSYDFGGSIQLMKTIIIERLAMRRLLFN